MAKIIKPEVELILPESARNSLLDHCPFLSRRQFLVRGSILATASSILCLGPSHKAFGLLIPSKLNNDIHSLLLHAIGFNGERVDPVTGLYHLGQGYRVYNPTLKRFHQFDISASPFGKGGLNGYLYCFSNPVGYVDPTGKASGLGIFMGILGLLLSIAGIAASIVSFGAASGVAAGGIAILSGVSATFGAVSSGLAIANSSIDETKENEKLKRNLSIASMSFGVGAAATGLAAGGAGLLSAGEGAAQVTLQGAKAIGTEMVELSVEGEQAATAATATAAATKGIKFVGNAMSVAKTAIAGASVVGQSMALAGYVQDDKKLLVAGSAIGVSASVVGLTLGGVSGIKGIRTAGSIPAKLGQSGLADVESALPPSKSQITFNYFSQAGKVIDYLQMPLFGVNLATLTHSIKKLDDSVKEL